MPLIHRYSPLLALACLGACTRKTNSDLAYILSKPFIAGASVSADRGSLSPGKKLALRYTSSGDIKTVAVGGKAGRELIKRFSADDLRDRTILIALDFFFWDSTLDSATESLAALDTLLSRCREQNLSLVLGEIPELLRGRQPQRHRLNRAIQEKCLSENSCFVMPFDRFHSEVKETGYWSINGKKLPFGKIVPDGLHLSEEAGSELANVLADLLSGK